MRDPEALRTVLNEGGPPRLVIELRPPEGDGDPVALIVERDPRLSSFTIALMLQQLSRDYTIAAERHRRDLADAVLRVGKVELSEGIEEALMDGPRTRWGHLEMGD